MFLLLQHDLLDLSPALYGWNLLCHLQLALMWPSKQFVSSSQEIPSLFSMAEYTSLRVGMLCMLVSLTHLNLIAKTCHLSGYVLIYLVQCTLTNFYFSISFWLTNLLINDAEHLSLNCVTSMANYFTFLSSAFLSRKMPKCSPKHLSMHLSSQSN
jgi:hypothetical protein